MLSANFRFSDFFGPNSVTLSFLNCQSKVLLLSINSLLDYIVQYYYQQVRGKSISLQHTCGDFEEFSFCTVRGKEITFLYMQLVFPCGLYQYYCIHQLLGDAIGLENLKHLSPVHRVKGISEVNECNYCQQVSGSDP